MYFPLLEPNMMCKVESRKSINDGFTPSMMCNKQEIHMMGGKQNKNTKLWSLERNKYQRRRA